jgi:hypothetical protein
MCGGCVVLLQVSIEPPVTNKKVCRDIMKKLRETFGEAECGGKIGAYDGEKSLFKCFWTTTKAPRLSPATEVADLETAPKFTALLQVGKTPPQNSPLAIITCW